ncbi:MAG TPA: nucleotidyltransferase domain-containing protein [Dehalococcoidia bacterium]|nr:nucleotidyltransferase domain-containing protein [Dehalococcoidia bacterium]
MAAADLDALRAERARRLESELDRIVGELRSMGARLIVLFGSYAAGRRDLFTDLDLLVVMESDLPFVRRIPALLERLHPKVATDLLVYTPEEFEEMRERPFVRHALATGKVLHEAI